MKTNIKKMANKDAFNWARAEMFFGEGAGTRRKLLNAEISDKAHSIPGYRELFEKAYYKQNMADHAIKAAKERARLDHVSYLGKNVKALLTGRVQNMSPSFIVIVGAGIVLHQTGYDKVLWAKGKKFYLDSKEALRQERAKIRLNNQEKPDAGS